MNNNYHGLWIPKEILTDSRLSKTEMLIYSIIDALDNSNGCYASNAYIAAQIGIDERNVRANLRRLEQAGYIIRTELDNGYRKIETTSTKTIRTVKESGKCPDPLAVAFESEEGEDANILGGRTQTSGGGGCKHPPNSIEDNIEDIDNKDKPIKGMIKIPDYPYNTEKFISAWGRWIDYRKEIKKKLAPSSIKSQFKFLQGLDSEDIAIQSIENSIKNGWAGLFPVINSKNTKQSTTTNQHAKGF
jgi:DNA-binding MarR family transcriptional regulator